MGEFVFHCQNDIVQFREISVVEASPTRQLPDPLDRIQLRAVRRKEVESEMFEVLLPPLGVKPGMVEAGVVCNHHDTSSGAAADGPKLFEKLPASEGVEFIRLASKREFAVPQADRAEVATPRRVG
jgi:hypothetical protein